MFRRRKSEGFEWREYVRTTILVRRKERRQRVEDVKVAAVEGLKDAGRKGFEAGSKGATTATRTFAELLQLAGRGIATALRNAWPATKIAAVRARQLGEDSRHRVRDAVVPLLGAPLERVRTPTVLFSLKCVALALALLAAIRALSFGLDGDTQAALWVSLAAVVIYELLRLSDPDPATEVPSISAKLGAALGVVPGLDAMSDRTRGGAMLGVVALGLAGVFAWQEAPTLSSLMKGATPLSTSSINTSAPAALEGRATALTGATLKLAGETLVLDGIEAPEMEQICRRPGGSWRCGETAKQGLADKLRGKRITCSRVGTTAEGRASVRCELNGEDIAKALVADGAVFASDGLFSSYASAQTVAKDKRLGLWAGDNDRPQDYRAKRWDEAKKQAPDGCPIKGRVRSGARTYVLPWSPSYDTVRINTTKGERWFCSEDEAITAGWSKAARL